MAAAWLDADWPAPRSVRAFTTLRHGLGESVAPFDHFNLGNHRATDGDDAVTVERNRALMVEHARLPAAPHWLRQVHGTSVVRVGELLPLPFTGEAWPALSLSKGGEGAFGLASRIAADADSGHSARPHPPGAGPEQRRRGHLLSSAHPSGAAAGEGRSREPEADASVTSTPGNVLAILTADCLPVLLCAADGSEVAAAHAGWRGLAAGVIEATVASMRTPADRMIAWLGPAAGPQHYEIGVEVYDAFVAQDWTAGRAFTSTRPQHWRVDLYELARQRLARAGVSPAQVHGGGLCTIADPRRFYSHRRDRRSGRMASLVWIDPGR